VLDVRYYPSRCFSTSDAQAIIDSKKTVCVPNCILCSSPEACQTCKNGYYLALPYCKPCNSCCDGCTGPGSSNCVKCASSCTMISANTCLRKSLFSLLYSVRKLFRNVEIELFDVSRWDVYAAI
jgi:hypothetical protein